MGEDQNAAKEAFQKFLADLTDPALEKEAIQYPHVMTIVSKLQAKEERALSKEKAFSPVSTPGSCRSHERNVPVDEARAITEAVDDRETTYAAERTSTQQSQLQDSSNPSDDPWKNGQDPWSLHIKQSPESLGSSMESPTPVIAVSPQEGCTQRAPSSLGVMSCTPSQDADKQMLGSTHESSTSAVRA